MYFQNDFKFVVFLKGDSCCGYGMSGAGSNGYDCVMIPGASTKTTKNPAPNSYCGGAFVGFNSFLGLAPVDFTATQTICSKKKAFILRRL